MNHILNTNRLVLLSIFLLICTSISLQATTASIGGHVIPGFNIITVDCNGTADYNTIGEAIENADERDTILVKEGTYRELVIVDKPLFIRGDGYDRTFLVANDMDFGMIIDADNVFLEGISFSNGVTGLSIFGNGSQINNISCTDNNGGIILHEVQDCRINNSMMLFNNLNGLLVEKSGNITIEGCNFSGNEENGLVLEDSDNITVLDGIGYGNDENGICIKKTTRVEIINVTTDMNNNSGIMIGDKSSQITLWGDNCNRNKNGIIIDECWEINISNCIISSNAVGFSIWKIPIDSTIQYNRISDNDHGIIVSDEIIFFSKELTLDAAYNWWGHPSGPYHILKNPDGVGNDVTDAVNFNPWFHVESCKFIRPDAIIDRLTPNPAIKDQTISFSANAIDDGTITKFTWISDIYGTIHEGTKADFSTSDLPVGTHRIGLQVLDDHGLLSDIVYTNLEISTPPMLNKNAPPILTVINPIDGSDLFGEVIIHGTVIDHEDDDITVEMRIDDGIWVHISNLSSWFFKFNSSILEEGNHRFSFRASDGELSSNTVLINFAIENEEKSSEEELLPGPDSPYVAIGVVSMCLVGLVTMGWRREDIRYAVFSILATPLYTKLKRNRILNQKTRSDIFNYITKYPGINFSRLKDDLDMANGVLGYHLGVLERERFIQSQTVVGRKLFFPKDATWKVDKSIHRLYPLSENQKRIIMYLLENGPSTMKKLEQKLSMKQPTMNYNIRKLVERGIIRSLGGRRNAKFQVIGEYSHDNPYRKELTKAHNS